MYQSFRQTQATLENLVRQLWICPVTGNICHILWYFIDRVWLIYKHVKLSTDVCSSIFQVKYSTLKIFLIKSSSVIFYWSCLLDIQACKSRYYVCSSIFHMKYSTLKMFISVIEKISTLRLEIDFQLISLISLSQTLKLSLKTILFFFIHYPRTHSIKNNF